MALFEKRYTNKVLLDDTEKLTSVIENAKTIDGHTEYVIRTQRGPLPEKSWRVSRRYNDFIQLNATLSISGIDLALPPKKIIGNMEPDFIAQRQVALQNYLNNILMNPILASSLPMKKFLDPDNYTAPLHEIALQQVSLALRSDANFEVSKAIPDMGWRLRKHYYTVKNRQNPKQELLLAWVEFGPDKHLQDKDMQGVFKSLGTLKHNYIESIVCQHVTENGALMIRNFYPTGTLRDILCVTKPKQPFIKKYGNPKQTKSLTVPEIAMYGYQILEALRFLHEKGLPYGHLHTGNILLTQRCAKLLDIENGLLGLPAFYRPYVTQVDVYSFGHVLYEMAFGRPLLEATCAELPYCEATLKCLLEVILSPEALKQDLPTVSHLSEHPFFESAKHAALAAGSIERPYFKLNSHLKEALHEAVNKAEQRLKDEQKKKEQKLAQEQRSANQLSANGMKHVNGKSPERSDSPTSTSTVTSVGTLTPPSLRSIDVPQDDGVPAKSIIPPPPSQLPPPVDVANSGSRLTNERAALLGSICNFNKTSLRNVANGYY
ncbi:PX domain-containing protein kinase-like protein [Eufriesea mexicana]|nr:PX domain-containing protein kinase-like protein [Eufriesea mexicana]